MAINPHPDGKYVRGIAHRCVHPELPGQIVELRCELRVGHDGPMMPPDRHTGRDRHGVWHVWSGTWEELR